MAKSSAPTVARYLAELPAERRASIARVRAVIRKRLPKGYRESMNWGMICWQIPLTRYPDTYNGQPLGYVALAAQKNHYALYLMGVYADQAQSRTLAAAYKALGRKPDMGKSCVRFRKPEDLPLAAILELVGSMPVDDYVAACEKGRARA